VYQQIGLKFKEETKCYIWSTVLFGAEIWTLQEVDQKHLEHFEMWHWRRIGWTEHVRNEEVRPRVKEVRNILCTIKGRKADWIGYIVHKGYILQGDKEEDLSCHWMTKEMRGYWKLKEEALDHTV
jgi:hypothetical protein